MEVNKTDPKAIEPIEEENEDGNATGSPEKKKEATREKNAKERKATGINTPSCLMRGVPGRECTFLDSNKIPES